MIVRKWVKEGVGQSEEIQRVEAERKGVENRVRMKCNLDSLWKTFSKLIFRDSIKIIICKNIRAKCLKMPRDKTGYSSYQHVSFLLVSLGKDGKTDIGLWI